MKRALLILFLLISVSSFAQFFQGWGIMAGGTLGRQYWYYDEPIGKEKQKYLLRWNGEVFAEFGHHPTFRWVTELQYNAKGTKREEVDGSTTKYLNHYAAWNNYLMIRKEMFAIIPYVKIGPRLEYVVSSPQDFKKFHLTGSLGAGVEFVAFGPVRFITEAHWVPDLSRSYVGVPDIKQHAWELRVGLKFPFGGGGEACPPVYK
ncbi:MAG TPA: outer membrane beta-barrel protein [Bacteroidia bacterium]|nr:outer membrane beta-barrel protein [Bacteroidia bacterium]